MDEKEVLNLINEQGEDAEFLLAKANPNFKMKFKRLNIAMIKFLLEVKVHFPEAQYYTSSGGFNLLLGEPHNDLTGIPQPELCALVGTAVVGDGDY